MRLYGSTVKLRRNKAIPVVARFCWSRHGAQRFLSDAVPSFAILRSPWVDEASANRIFKTGTLKLHEEIIAFHNWWKKSDEEIQAHAEVLSAIHDAWQDSTGTTETTHFDERNWVDFYLEPDKCHSLSGITTFLQIDDNNGLLNRSKAEAILKTLITKDILKLPVLHLQEFAHSPFVLFGKTHSRFGSTPFPVRVGFYSASEASAFENYQKTVLEARALLQGMQPIATFLRGILLSKKRGIQDAGIPGSVLQGMIAYFLKQDEPARLVGSLGQILVDLLSFYSLMELQGRSIDESSSNAEQRSYWTLLNNAWMDPRTYLCQAVPHFPSIQERLRDAQTSILYEINRSMIHSSVHGAITFEKTRQSSVASESKVDDVSKEHLPSPVLKPGFSYSNEPEERSQQSHTHEKPSRCEPSEPGKAKDDFVDSKLLDGMDEGPSATATSIEAPSPPPASQRSSESHSSDAEAGREESRGSRDSIRASEGVEIPSPAPAPPSSLKLKSEKERTRYDDSAVESEMPLVSRPPTHPSHEVIRELIALEKSLPISDSASSEIFSGETGDDADPDASSMMEEGEEEKEEILDKESFVLDGLESLVEPSSSTMSSSERHEKGIPVDATEKEDAPNTIKEEVLAEQPTASEDPEVSLTTGQFESLLDTAIKESRELNSQTGNDANETLRLEASLPTSLLPSWANERHSLAAFKDDFSDYVAPWTERYLFRNPPKNLGADARLHQQINSFYNYVRPSSKEKFAYKEVAHRLRRSLQQIEIAKGVPGVNKATLFGSFASGALLPQGDIDINFDCAKYYARRGPTTLQRRRKIMYKTVGALVKAGLITKNFEVIPFARIPVVNCETTPELGSISVDIAFNTDYKADSVTTIYQYFCKMPALRPLLMLLKQFLLMRGLNKPRDGGLGSYPLMCMIISFLQINYAGRPQEYIDKPFENYSLGILLKDFLWYYGSQFPYTTAYIDIEKGLVLPRSSEEWMHREHDMKVAILCPVTGVDAGRATWSMSKIKLAFLEAFETLSQLPVTSMHGLTSFVQINKRVVDFRARLEKLVDAGNFGEFPPKEEMIRGTRNASLKDDSEAQDVAKDSTRVTRRAMFKEVLSSHMEDASVRGRKGEDKATYQRRGKAKSPEQSLPNWKQKMLKKRARKITEELRNDM